MSVLLLAAALHAATIGPADSSSLYRAVLVRAAPGHLLELIDWYRSRGPALDAAGDHRPFMMRHSQGDQWDLLLLYPMDSFEAFYAADRTARRSDQGGTANRLAAGVAEPPGGLVAWREEVFTAGPPPGEVGRVMESGAYYHVEMFVAIPGKRAELVRERVMENAYLSHLGRPINLIFTRVAGAAWDAFTIGVYHDIKHFAESADIPADQEDAAARAAGFESADRIGTYLRTLIQYHHDTLARAVR